MKTLLRLDAPVPPERRNFSNYYETRLYSMQQLVLFVLDGAKKRLDDPDYIFEYDAALLALQTAATDVVEVRAYIQALEQEVKAFRGKGRSTAH